MISIVGKWFILKIENATPLSTLVCLSRRPGEESDGGESCRESSSEESTNCNAESPKQDGMRSNRQGLVFEYFERNPPYSREPLADKVNSFFSWMHSSLVDANFCCNNLCFNLYLRFQFLHVNFPSWRIIGAVTYSILAGYLWLGMLLSFRLEVAVIPLPINCCWHLKWNFVTGIQYIGYPRDQHYGIWMLAFWRFTYFQNLRNVSIYFFLPKNQLVCYDQHQYF